MVALLSTLTVGIGVELHMHPEAAHRDGISLTEMQSMTTTDVGLIVYCTTHRRPAEQRHIRKRFPPSSLA